MAWQRQGSGVIVIGLSAWLVSGCLSNPPDWAISKESLTTDLAAPNEQLLVRLQTQDSPPSPPSPPVVTLQKPAPAADDSRAPLVLPPPTPDSGIQQASMSNRGTVRISVRAWVNHQPIFEDEVMQMGGNDILRANQMSEPQRTIKLAEVEKVVLDNLIDQEVMYQEACKILEKVGPQHLKKLNSIVDQEFEKTLDKWKAAKIPEERIRELEPTARRLTKRNLISTEFARNKIMDIVKQSFGFTDVREYYESHKNEFMTVDSVTWQDIFIPINPPNLPTLEAVKRFAEEQIKKCRTPADFEKLMVYNEGPSKLNTGEGLGHRFGTFDKEAGHWKDSDIQPPEMIPHLFDLREGEIGPVVAFSTGVHLIRMSKREYAGQMPLDHKLQTTIRKKLEGELAERSIAALSASFAGPPSSKSSMYAIRRAKTTEPSVGIAVFAIRLSKPTRFHLVGFLLRFGCCQGPTRAYSVRREAGMMLFAFGLGELVLRADSTRPARACKSLLNCIRLFWAVSRSKVRCEICLLRASRSVLVVSSICVVEIRLCPSPSRCDSAWLKRLRYCSWAA